MYDLGILSLVLLARANKVVMVEEAKAVTALPSRERCCDRPFGTCEEVVVDPSERGPRIHGRVRCGQRATHAEAVGCLKVGRLVRVS